MESTGNITERTHITSAEFYENGLQNCGKNLKYWFLSYSVLFLFRYAISLRYLSLALSLPFRPPEQEAKQAEETFETLYVRTYRYFPPLFFVNILIGNLLYFQFDETLFKTCIHYNDQFEHLTNYCTFLLCLGYVMAVYYFSLWLSVTCFAQKEPEPAQAPQNGDIES